MLTEEQANLLNRLLVAERYFIKSAPVTVHTAKVFYEEGNYDGCKTMLNNLPTQEQLLDELIEELKGKSIYKAIKEIQSGYQVNKFTKIKVISSLITHVCIDCEHEDSDLKYSYLLPWLYDQLSIGMYQ